MEHGKFSVEGQVIVTAGRDQPLKVPLLYRALDEDERCRPAEPDPDRNSLSTSLPAVLIDLLIGGDQGDHRGGDGHQPAGILAVGSSARAARLSRTVSAPIAASNNRIGKRMGLTNLGLNVNTLLADPLKLFTRKTSVPDGATTSSLRLAAVTRLLRW